MSEYECEEHEWVCDSCGKAGPGSCVEQTVDNMTAEIEQLKRQRDLAVEALKKIATTKHCNYSENSCGMYGVGVTDGHRLAAQWAREALENINETT